MFKSMPFDGRADDDIEYSRSRVGDKDNTREEGEDEGDEEEEDAGHLKEEVLSIAIKVIPELDEVKALSDLRFLASGGYNSVWRVTYILVRKDC